MLAYLRHVLAVLRAFLRSRAGLQIEILALRHQLIVYERTAPRPRLHPTDRLFWSILSRRFVDWREALVIVKPETVLRWRRRRFREHWARLSRSGRRAGRPRVPQDLRGLIRRMRQANPTWGSPRICGELAKLGLDVARSTVDKYLPRTRPPVSPTWKTFLEAHTKDLVAVDFFTVPTIRNRVLFVFVVLALDRRRVVHFNVTTNPTAEWTARQIVQAFPYDSAPKYLVRDRDNIYGDVFSRRVRGMGIEEVITSYRSPWQNGYVERLIGTIRRECLDYMIIFSEGHLRRVLKRYFAYYHRWRTHLGLDMDCPEPRRVQSPEEGEVVEVPEVYGLHHHYERRAA
jgi:putative transposase